jgi:hypothetical protein
MCIKQLIHAFRQFRQGISNLIDWFPIVWNDRDWDHGFMLDMLSFKLHRMNDFFHSGKGMADPNDEHTKTAYQKLLFSTILIDYLKEQKYQDVAFREHYKKYPLPPFKDMWIDIGNNLMEYIGSHREGEDMSFEYAIEKEKRYKRTAEAQFFGILRNYYDFWWD